MATRRRHDSNEDEATAIDMREASSKIQAALAKRRAAPASPVSPRAPTLKATHDSNPAYDEPLHGSSEADEEDTEFLVRPSSVSSSSPASDEDSRTAALPRRWAAPEAAPRATLPPAKGAREPAPPAAIPKVPETGAEVGLPPAALPRMPRPLPGREETTAATPLGAPGGPTAPRITRIFMSPEAQAAQRRPTPEELRQHAADFDDELTAPTDPAANEPESPPKMPSPRPPTIVAAIIPDADRTDPPQSVPQPAPQSVPQRPRTKTARTSISGSTTGGDSQTLEAEPADGTLIVDVPAGAVVFINGVERGRGPSLRVRELDRYAKHAVRVHADGFSPWKGSVSLDGRVAAKVRPNLRPRAR